MKIKISSTMKLPNKGYYGLETFFETRIFFKELKVRMCVAYYYDHSFRMV